MSAFVVSKSCIDKCVCAWSKILDHARHNPISHDLLDATGQALMRMNYTAVAARYPAESRAGEEEVIAAYRYAAPKNAYAINKTSARCQVYKALQCLRYQCSEGEVPKSALYRDLTERMHEMASIIIEGLPDYGSAPWGE